MFLFSHPSSIVSAYESAVHTGSDIFSLSDDLESDDSESDDPLGLDDPFGSTSSQLDASAYIQYDDLAECDCSTVTYSLFAACAYCQGASLRNFT